MPAPLLWSATGHAVLAVACALALLRRRPPIMGVHPALKPLRFAVSIALFLATMGLVLPRLSVAPAVRALLAWLFASTMVVEMAIIAAQALGGTTSHFNVSGARNATRWTLMVGAIVAATVGLLAVATLASALPLVELDGRELEGSMAWAWRAGLWLLALSPVSGFAMGSRMRHSVGGDDGGPGLPVVSWSVEHGDLRVAHFFSLHAVQVLPALAWCASRLGLPMPVRTAVVLGAAAVLAVACVGTLLQAFAGRPLVRGRSRQREGSDARLRAATSTR
ncbi:MAG: hypothetical protein KC657_12785 [Myxococcales bacterium]|nr:hypothetical protein [Myxococcales bacterium]